MQQLILIVHVLIAIALISLVLIQHGRGADIGASFGSGSANTMFGSVGPASFLMKLTAILGIIFFATSIGLGLLAARHQDQVDFMPVSSLPSSQPTSIPAGMLTAPPVPAKK